MTKRDYKLIAKSLAKCSYRPKLIDVASQLAADLAMTNPRFNTSKFMNKVLEGL